MDKNFFDDYFKFIYDGTISVDQSDLRGAAEIIRSVSGIGKKLMIAGNGGSAAMASHAAVDFTKAAGVRAVNFNEADLLTCFSNDYGYEHVFEKAVEFYGDDGDLLLLVSSSGKSPNIINAAQIAKELDIEVITLSGFDDDNPLRSLGTINLWVDSRAYNVVEMTHHIWILAMVDYLVGDIHYSAS